MRLLKVQNSDVVKNIDEILTLVKDNPNNKIEDSLNWLKDYLTNEELKEGILSSNYFTKCAKYSLFSEAESNEVLKAVNSCYIDILIHLRVTTLKDYKRFYSFFNNYLEKDSKNNSKNSLEYDLHRIQLARQRADNFLKNIQDVETSEMAITISERITNNSLSITFSWFMMILGVFFIINSPKVSMSIFELKSFSMKDNYLNLIPVISPAVLIIFYFMRLSFVLIRQRTDMVFKYDSIRLYMNYKSITSIDDECEIKNKLLSNLISVLSENPTRLDMKNENSLELKEISDLLKNIQSASGVKQQ